MRLVPRVSPWQFPPAYAAGGISNRYPARIGDRSSELNIVRQRYARAFSRWLGNWTTEEPFHRLAARVASHGKEQKMATPIWQWSAVDTAGAIRDGNVTSEEVVRAHVERMR